MSSRLLKLPVVLALMVSIGLHWAFLQSVAWVGMVVSYSQTDSLSVALEKTFDGQHPCRLCHFVKDGQQQEQQKQDAQKPGPKFDACLDADHTFVFATAPEITASPLTASPCARFSAPPLPPPRLA